jgi:excisionase family DNA binding protein
MQTSKTETGNTETFKAALAAVEIYREADVRQINIEGPIFLKDACDITGYKKNTIYSLITKKEIPFHKVAGRQKVFFYKSELVAWMNKSEVKEVIDL